MSIAVGLPDDVSFSTAQVLDFLSARFSLDEYRAVFPVNVTSPAHERLPVLDIEIVAGHGTLLWASPCSV